MKSFSVKNKNNILIFSEGRNKKHLIDKAFKDKNKNLKKIAYKLSEIKIPLSRGGALSVEEIYNLLSDEENLKELKINIKSINQKSAQITEICKKIIKNLNEIHDFVLSLFKENKKFSKDKRKIWLHFLDINSIKKTILKSIYLIKKIQNKINSLEQKQYKNLDEKIIINYILNFNMIPAFLKEEHKKIAKKILNAKNEKEEQTYINMLINSLKKEKKENKIDPEKNIFDDLKLKGIIPIDFDILLNKIFKELLLIKNYMYNNKKEEFTLEEKKEILKSIEEIEELINKKILFAPHEENINLNTIKGIKAFFQKALSYSKEAQRKIKEYNSSLLTNNKELDISITKFKKEFDKIKKNFKLKESSYSDNPLINSMEKIFDELREIIKTNKIIFLYLKKMKNTNDLDELTEELLTMLSEALYKYKFIYNLK